MVRRKAKTLSTQNQTCVKYRGIIIFIKRITYANTVDLTIHGNLSFLVLTVWQTLYIFVFNIRRNAQK